MNIDQSQSQVASQTSFDNYIEVQKGQNEALEAIARFLGARPVAGAISIGPIELPGVAKNTSDDAQLERTEIIANLDISELSFSDAASIMSLARDPAPSSTQTSSHDSALLGATIAAQTSLAEHAHANHAATDHLSVLTDYYAAHV